MSTAWCYSCGKDHIAPRGRNCKEQPEPGYKPLPARRSSRLKDTRTKEEVQQEAEEVADKSLADLHGEEKFGSRAEYLEYLEALDADQEEQARVEALEEKIRARITGHRPRSREKKKDKKDRTPPSSREGTPDPGQVPRTSTPRYFDYKHEGRDGSAERITKMKKRFDLKRFTRGREPRSLSYAELMYVSLQWACVGIEDQTFNDLQEIRKFLRHLGFVSFKASSDLYEDWSFAEYDADVREECIWGKDIDEFNFGLDFVEKRHFGTEGVKKAKKEVHHEGKNPGRGRGRGTPANRGRGGSYAQSGAPPAPAPGRFSQGVRTNETGDVIPCHRFNGAGCDSRPCAFAHVCGKCHDPTHRSGDCSNVRMHKA